MDQPRWVISEIPIRVRPQEVICAFTDPELLRGWWNVERCFIELQPEGVYILAWEITADGFKYINSGLVMSYHPHSHLHIHHMMYLHPEKQMLGPFQLLMDVRAVEGGSHLMLSQGPYPENAGEDWEWYYDAVKNAWPQVLITLKSYLEKEI